MVVQTSMASPPRGGPSHAAVQPPPCHPWPTPPPIAARWPTHIGHGSGAQRRCNLPGRTGYVGRPRAPVATLPSAASGPHCCTRRHTRLSQLPPHPPRRQARPCGGRWLRWRKHHRQPRPQRRAWRCAASSGRRTPGGAGSRGTQRRLEGRRGGASGTVGDHSALRNLPPSPLAWAAPPWVEQHALVPQLRLSRRRRHQRHSRPPARPPPRRGAAAQAPPAAPPAAANRLDIRAAGHTGTLREKVSPRANPGWRAVANARCRRSRCRCFGCPSVPLPAAGARHQESGHARRVNNKDLP